MAAGSHVEINGELKVNDTAGYCVFFCNGKDGRDIFEIPIPVISVTCLVQSASFLQMNSLSRGK